MKSRNCFLLGLLLLLAAALLLRQGEQRRLRDQSGTGAELASARPGLWKRFTQLPAVLLGRRPSASAPVQADAGPVQPPITSLSDDKHFPFRVRNTQKKDAELFRSETAVLLRNALVETREPVRLNIPEHLRAQGDPGSYLVQARGTIDGQFRAVLRGAGVEIVSYVPNNTFLVRAHASLAQQLRLSPRVQSVLPFEPFYKLDLQLLPLAVRREAIPEGRWLNLVLFSGAQDRAKADLRALGAEVKSEQPFPFGHVVTIAPRADSLVALAQLPAVQNIEAYHSPILMNDLSRVRLDVSVGTTNAATTNANWMNLSGAGVTVGLPDSGVDLGHSELIGRTFVNASSPLADDYTGHGTHVAGALAALGSSTPASVYGSISGASQRGIAHGAKVYPLSLLDVSYTNYGNLWIVTNMATATNIHIVNNSWGYPVSAYDINAAFFDQSVRDSHPSRTNDQQMTYVFAVGNLGGANSGGTGGRADSINSPGNAKNVISVGALEQFRLVPNSVVTTNNGTNDIIAVAHTDSDSQVADYSGRGNVGVGIEGPGGRFKPDVVAPGSYALSLRATTFAITNSTEADASLGSAPPGTYWRFDSGTSIAAAKVSGVLALMEEFFSVNYGLTNGLTPSLNKALLINRAGSASLAYDFSVNNPVTHQGWGVPSLSNTVPTATAYAFLTNAGPAAGQIVVVDEGAFVTNHLTSGQYHAYDVTLPAIPGSLTNQLKITLAWTDPPGNPIASTKLVNDLDLYVTNTVANGVALVNGAQYEGNNFAPGSTYTQPTSPSGQSQRDSVNNVENAYILITNTVNNVDAVSTTFRVYVIGRKVNVNAVTANTNDVVQDYTLVISSDTTANVSVIPAAAPNFATYTNRLVATVTNGIPYLNERVAANSPFAFIGGALANTNGTTNQWNFYVFTNQDLPPVITNLVTNIIAGATNVITNLVRPPITNGGPYVTFATFLPPNLARARNKEADVDLYMTRSLFPPLGGASGLTNLDPAVLSDPNTLRSTNRGGYELIATNNSAVGEVFYIGIKSEDQQGGQYGFFASASQTPFYSTNTNGAPIIALFPVPADIPDGSPESPGGVTLYGVCTTNTLIRSADVVATYVHENLGDLVGTITHNGTIVTLNNHTITPGATFPGASGLQTNNLIFDSFRNPPDGPGDVTDYLGMDAVGLWIFEVYDNSPFLTGRVDSASVYISPFTNSYNPTNVIVRTTPVLAPGQSFVDFLDVPTYATNLDVDIIGGLPPGPIPGGGGASGQGVDIFAGYLFVPAQSNFTAASVDLDSLDPLPNMRISPTTSPPLTPGRWNFRLVNNTGNSLQFTYRYTLGYNLATANTQFYFTNSLVSLLDNYTTNLFMTVQDDRVIAGVEVGLAILHPRVQDLVIHLISPSGSRVLLFENRGGTNGDPAALNPFTSNLFANFTENTNRTTSVDTNGPAAYGFLHYNYLLPIKFVPAPFSAAISPPRLMTNMTNTIYGYAGNNVTSVSESPRALAFAGQTLVMAGLVNRNGTNDAFLASYTTPIATNDSRTNWAVTNLWTGPQTGYRGPAASPDQTYFRGVAVNTDGVVGAGLTRNYFPPPQITWSGTNTRNAYDLDLGCYSGSVTLGHLTDAIHDRILIEYEGRPLMDFTPPGATAMSFISNVTFHGASRFMRVTVNPVVAAAAGSTWTNTLTVYRSNGVEYAVADYLSGTFTLPPQTVPVYVPPAPLALSTPSGVALDASNNVYVADTANNRVLKFNQVLTIPNVLAPPVISDTNGTYVPLTFTAAPHAPPLDQLRSPSAVAVHTNGDIYVADTANNLIKRYDGKGAWIESWGDVVAGTAGIEDSGVGGFPRGRFSGPQGITIGTNGFLYVADTGNNLVRQIDAAGLVTTIPIPATFGTLNGPRGIVVHQTADPIALGGGNTSTLTTYGTAFTSGTNLYVTDTLNHRVVWLQRSNATWAVIHLAGSTLGVAGSADQTATLATFNTPSGIARDGYGNLYVTDAGTHRLRKVTPLGAVQTIAGSSSGNVLNDSGLSAKFNTPLGVAADNFGAIFVADSVNNAIRSVSPYQTSTPTNAYAAFFPVAGPPTNGTGLVGSPSLVYSRGISNSVFGMELGGFPSRDYLSGVVTSPENGTNFLYTVGSSQFSSNSALGLDNYERMFVSKVSTNGQVIWQRGYLEVAVIHAVTNGLGAITSLVLDSGGSGYSAVPVVTILDPLNPVPANKAIGVTVTVAGGVVTSVPATALPGPFIAPRVYVEAPTSLTMPGTAVAVAYGTNVIAAGYTNSSAVALTTNNFPFLMSLNPTNGTVFWATNSPASGHYNGLAVSSSGIIAVGGAYIAGNTLQSSNLIEKWSFVGTQMLSTVHGFGVGRTGVLNGVVVVDSIDRAYAAGSVFNSDQTVDAVMLEIDLTSLAVLSVVTNNLTNFSGVAVGIKNSTNYGTAIATDGVDIYVSVEGPCPGNRTDRQAGLFRYRAKNFYLPEESLDQFVGERTWAVRPFATNSSGTLTNVTVTNQQWQLEIADTRVGGTNGAAQVLSWNLNFSYAASNTTSLPLPPATNSNFVLLSAGQKFVVTAPAAATMSTNFVSASAPVRVTFNPTGAPVPGAPGNVVVFTGTTGSFVVSSAAGSVARFRPGSQYYFSVEPLNGASNVGLSVQVNFDKTSAAPVVTPLVDGAPSSGFIPRTAALNHYQFTVPVGASAALFEIYNVNGDVNLYLRRSNGASSLPSTTAFDYRSANPGTVNEQIFVVTNGASATALTPGIWFASVQNVDNSPVNYTVRATSLAGVPYTVITASDGQSFAAVTPPGNAPGTLFRLPVTTTQKGLLFEVRNLNGDGDLVVRKSAFPLATTFDASNFRAGHQSAIVAVRTNAGLPSLVGDWYFGVLNRGATHLSYNVMSRQASNGVLLGSSPIQILRSAGASSLVTGTNFGFDLDVVPGEKYQVQYRTNLATGTWLVLTNITAPADGLVSFLHSGALSNRNLYYRIQVVP